MYLIFLFLLGSNDGKSIEVQFTENAPVIDGVIEDIWEGADSVYDFIQFMPYEKTNSTERTVVFVLQDNENLYFAFRCYAEKNPPTAILTADEDDIRIAIDPFGSKTSGYWFMVYGSGIRNEGWVLDDGRNYDDSWDGVWYRAVKVHEDCYEVEVKIPFKSIRYKKGLNQWGLELARYIAYNRELSLWNEHLQKEGVLLSKSGTLKGVNPKVSGYYFELYPEGYVRYDRDEARDTTKIKPRLSLNFKWDVTPQSTINATIYPDFAQIESDPFTLNLSRYPTYLDERRPFFLEGMDIFRMADFEEGWGFFNPLEIFYSRKVGKSINDDAIPIIGGLKFTHKKEDWHIGALSAYTDDYTNEQHEINEPNRYFGVFRAKRSIFENSDIGVLFSGSIANRNDYNYALGMDGTYRKGVNQVILQGAVSDKNKKRGWAFNAGYFGYIKNFITFLSTQVIHDSLDVSDVGFVPWAGRKRILIMSGPYWEYDRGFIRNYWIAPGILLIQEPGDSDWSIVGKAEINAAFRNDWGFDFNIGLGRYYEADTNYLCRYINLSTWGRLFGNHINFGCDYNYSYNYNRGFLAYQGNNWFSYIYSIIPQMSVGLASNFWIEWDTDNSILAIWPMLRPSFRIKINADMGIDIFNEIVMQTPRTNFSEIDLLSNRFGFLFSWNFKPKSWLYIALNDYRVQIEDGGLQPLYQIGAIKAKYLIYF